MSIVHWSHGATFWLQRNAMTIAAKNTRHRLLRFHEKVHEMSSCPGRFLTKKAARQKPSKTHDQIVEEAKQGALEIQE